MRVSGLAIRLFSDMTEAFLTPWKICTAHAYRSRGAGSSAPLLPVMQTLVVAIHANDSANGSPSRWMLSPYMLQKHTGICPQPLPPLSPSWLFFCQASLVSQPGLGSKTLLWGHQLHILLGVDRTGSWELSRSLYPTDSLRDHQRPPPSPL